MKISYKNNSEFMILVGKIIDKNIVEYEVLEELWREFFTVVLKSFGFNSKSIYTLFIWGQDGHNWGLLHSENSEYKDNTKEEWIKSFKSEVDYINDRLSLDRLFRTHWLFNTAFYDEINMI